MGRPIPFMAGGAFQGRRVTAVTVEHPTGADPEVAGGLGHRGVRVRHDFYRGLSHLAGTARREEWCRSGHQDLRTAWRECSSSDSLIGEETCISRIEASLPTTIPLNRVDSWGIAESIKKYPANCLYTPSGLALEVLIWSDNKGRPGLPGTASIFSISCRLLFLGDAQWRL